MDIIIGALIGIALGYIIIGILKVMFIGFIMVYRGICDIVEENAFLRKRNNHRDKCGLPKLTHKDLIK